MYSENVLQGYPQRDKTLKTTKSNQIVRSKGWSLDQNIVFQLLNIPTPTMTQ